MLIIILVVGLGMVAATTAAAGAVYDAVTEADAIAALDRPTLDAAKTLRSPLLTPLIQAYTTLGGPIGMPIPATLVAVGLTVWWRQPRRGCAPARAPERADALALHGWVGHDGATSTTDSDQPDEARAAIGVGRTGDRLERP